MRLAAIVLGVIGVIAAAGVWTLFVDWLNILGIFVPPIGTVLIVDQIVMRKQTGSRPTTAFHPTAFAAWAIGAVVAAIVHFGAPQWGEAVAGILAAAIAYLALTPLTATATDATDAGRRG